MAEVAGLALGAITLPTIFSSCLELADKIRDARNVGTDYEDAYSKHMLLLVRFRKCGTRHIILQQMEPTPGDERSLESEAIRRALYQIYLLLKKTHDLHDRYKSHAAHDEMVQPQVREASVASSFKDTATAINKASERRQRTLPLHRKVSWTMHDKKTLEVLIENFQFYIEQLENLLEPGQHELPMAQAATQNIFLCAQSQIAASNCGSEASREPRQLLQAADNPGHTYSHNIISGRARVRQGDVGHTAQVGARTHVYVGNSITGDARVLQGNISGTDMSSFWNN